MSGFLVLLAIAIAVCLPILLDYFMQRRSEESELSKQESVIERFLNLRSVIMVCPVCGSGIDPPSDNPQIKLANGCVYMQCIDCEHWSEIGRYRFAIITVAEKLAKSYRHRKFLED